MALQQQTKHIAVIQLEQGPTIIGREADKLDRCNERFAKLFQRERLLSVLRDEVKTEFENLQTLEKESVRRIVEEYEAEFYRHDRVINGVDEQYVELREENETLKSLLREQENLTVHWRQAYAQEMKKRVSAEEKANNLESYVRLAEKVRVKREQEIASVTRTVSFDEFFNRMEIRMKEVYEKMIKEDLHKLEEEAVCQIVLIYAQIMVSSKSDCQSECQKVISKRLVDKVRQLKTQLSESTSTVAELEEKIRIQERQLVKWTEANISINLSERDLQQSREWSQIRAGIATYDNGLTSVETTRSAFRTGIPFRGPLLRDMQRLLYPN